jgi:hypothetical protein
VLTQVHQICLNFDSHLVLDVVSEISVKLGRNRISYFENIIRFWSAVFSILYVEFKLSGKSIIHPTKKSMHLDRFSSKHTLINSPHPFNIIWEETIDKTWDSTYKTHCVAWRASSLLTSLDGNINSLSMAGQTVTEYRYFIVAFNNIKIYTSFYVQNIIQYELNDKIFVCFMVGLHNRFANKPTVTYNKYLHPISLGSQFKYGVLWVEFEALATLSIWNTVSLDVRTHSLVYVSE